MECNCLNRLNLDRKKAITIGTILAVVFLLIVLVTVVIIVWTMPDLKAKDGNTHICLKIDSDVKCSETTSTLKCLLEKEIAQVYKETAELDTKDTKDYFSSLDKKKSGELETVVSWFNGRELDYTTGFMRYGVRYQNGRLIVPLTGTYNIYSFLSLTEDIDPTEIRDKNTNATLIKHAMYKFNVKQEHDVELALCMQTHRRPTNRNFNAFSSHISTLVH
ncbi:uncharacterized protein LOC127834952 isoform X2 [Dreissena polymorpha]|uniref:uncharacterized protein LOC127834952 isoform X2 n=1 Tax=Dreissena polymorpha TaxID=45954 RepID=UPI002264684C|nr:uncharacterized protein LOC127834952 isoform X2 [Dreissena polymorpha]